MIRKIASFLDLAWSPKFSAADMDGVGVFVS